MNTVPLPGIGCSSTWIPPTLKRSGSIFEWNEAGLSSASRTKSGMTGGPSSVRPPKLSEAWPFRPAVLMPVNFVVVGAKSPTTAGVAR